jgi:uncharacterized membrane protein
MGAAQSLIPDVKGHEPIYVKQVCISFALFSLFFVAQALDFDQVLRDFGVAEAAITKAKLIYVYLFGYFLFIIKFFLAFLFFCIIILVIVIIFASFMAVVTANKYGDPEGEDKKIIDIAKNIMSGKVKNDKKDKNEKGGKNKNSKS